MRCRPRTLAAATLLAAAALALAATAGPAGAAPTATPTPTPAATTSPTPSPSPSSTYPTDYPPTSGPTSSAPGPTDPATPPIAPTGPADLRVSAVTTGSVTLTWTAATPGNHPIDRYEITYNQAFNDIFWLQNAVADATSITIVNGIKATGQYSFRITAIDTWGLRSSTGSSAGVVVPASDTAADRTPPSAPTNVAVTGSSAAGATLTWTPSTDNVGVTDYIVYRFDGLYVSTPIAIVTAPAATVAGTSGAQSIYVRARDAAGNLSAVSNTVYAPVITTPPAPTCAVTFKTTSQWQGGFVADIKISNPAAAAVDGWTLTFRFTGDQQIVQAWGANFTQSGIDVVLTGLSWNSTIPAGGSVSAGLLGTSWTAGSALPTAVALNGGTCTVA